jgi:hypothetical protein
MGSGLSAHPDELRSSERRATTTDLDAGDPFNDDDDKKALPKATGGGCPMKRKDGSFAMDWRALLRQDFPHGPSGRHPISEQQARATQTESSPAAAAVSSSVQDDKGRCPVKHQEYNVYSQPIITDSTNHMPSVANQLPAPGQSKSLSVERVASTIPKVSGSALHRFVETFTLANDMLCGSLAPALTRIHICFLTIVFRLLCGIFLWDDLGWRAAWHDVDLPVAANVLQCTRPQGQTGGY